MCERAQRSAGARLCLCRNTHCAQHDHHHVPLAGSEGCELGALPVRAVCALLHGGAAGAQVGHAVVGGIQQQLQLLGVGVHTPRGVRTCSDRVPHAGNLQGSGRGRALGAHHVKLVRLHVRGHALGAGHAVREAMRAKHWIQGTITNVGVLGGSRGGGCKEENGLHCDVRPGCRRKKVVLYLLLATSKKYYF